ncbi:cytochrome P450 [Xylogone sp. PMI_703]|nr:cytochrome P450 [Xylogone sp. PMI_703]
MFVADPSPIIILGVIIYRVKFHPLAKYPGPLLAKITGWYPAWHAWRGRRHIDQLRCHKLYGPVVRWGPDFIIFNTHTSIQQIYGESRNNNIRKADIYTYFSDGKAVASTQSTMEKAQASRKRRILSHAFSDAARKASDDFIVKNADRWCQLLGQTNGKEDESWVDAKDMTKYCDWWSFDTAMDLAFGKSYRLLDNPELRFLPSYIMSDFHGLTFYVVRTGLHRILSATELKNRDTFLTYAIKAMTERATRSEEEKHLPEPLHKDYFYFLERATDSESQEGYSIPEIQAECTLLMNAGSTAPSVVIDATFFYLTRYPAVYAKLVTEIRTTFSSVDEIVSGPKMNSCVYLKAVLKESLRLCPPISGVLPRQVMAGGETVDSVYLPEGTTIGVAAYCIHRNPVYYDNPAEFNPERWIESAVGEEAVSKARSGFFAFSLGASGCIGKAVAYQEMSITLARLLWRYDFRLKAGDTTGAGGPGKGRGREDPLEFQVKDIFAVVTKGPYIEFKKRK